MKIDYKKFLKERDESLLSLDEGKIIAYCKKYKVPIPKNKELFWAGVHKSILALSKATTEQKEHSIKWLLEHGFNPTIFGR